MPLFVPKTVSEIVADSTARILSETPITSSRLGEVIDAITVAFSNEVGEMYIEATNILKSINLDTISGRGLDRVASEYPDLAPRRDATNATGTVNVTDPAITKIDTVVASGGATAGSGTLNADTTGFPSSGTILVGNRDESNFETIAYTSITATQFILVGTLAEDHATSEPIVLSTVGDRIFAGVFTVATQASAEVPAKNYETQSDIIIFDGEEFGTVSVTAQETGSTIQYSSAKSESGMG